MNIKKIYFSKPVKFSINEYNAGTILYQNKTIEELLIELDKYIELSKKSDFMVTKNCLILENIYNKIKIIEPYIENINKVKLFE